jgi:hypothetical protein
MAESYFTFSNEGATKLLIPVEKPIPKAKDFKEAVCSNQSKVFLKYEKFKPATKASSNRQTYFNFMDQGGEYFHITSGKISNDHVCIISDPSFFLQRKILTMSLKKEECSLRDKTRIVALKKRKLQWCQNVSELTGLGHIFFAQFVKAGKIDLAVLGISAADKILLKEYPTDSSEWRVDEENIGKFPFESIKVFFPYQSTNKKIGLATEWPGAEGNNLEILEESGTELKTIETGYFYWSPL